MENGQSVFFSRLTRPTGVWGSPRFIDFFTDFEKKTDCFAVYYCSRVTLISKPIHFIIYGGRHLISMQEIQISMQQDTYTY